MRGRVNSVAGAVFLYGVRTERSRAVSYIFQ